MVKLNIEGMNPDTEENTTHSVEADAVCAVSIRKVEDSKMGVDCAIVGTMNGVGVEAMVEALLNACKELLKDVHPIIAAMILAKGLNKEEDDEDVAGTGSEPERPSEQ